jgi:hypothetical protein
MENNNLYPQHANRTHKASLFSNFFSSKDSYCVDLCNTLFNYSYPLETKIAKNTISNVFFQSIANDLSFIIGDQVVVLLEHQSYICQNMPICFLLYIAREYTSLLTNTEILANKLVKIPRPMFAVLYNGPNITFANQVELKLPDAFSSEGPINLELTVPIFNINHGKIPETISKCRFLSDYSFFLFQVAEFKKDPNLTLEQAIAEAVKYCISNNIIREYLPHNVEVVKDMLLSEITHEDIEKIRFEEGKAEGKDEIAKKLLACGFSVADVVFGTDLDEKIVRNLKAEIN